ncbi:reticulon-like protein B2 [Prunus yedoensis var. nudiflora]|uniref:Reticulon-like protein n=1 Tax=Prunus yedoensis var. nudiflora TaxID=2094558 RepID=A0A314UPD9_PRUYE|nr:reticulon-like protein B2 [Prunus yedoensis var. nudiflora]
MAEHKDEVKAPESMMGKIADKIHGHDSPVSPALESLHGKAEKAISSDHAASLKAKAYKLFGREKPVHNVFGGGRGTFRDRNSQFYLFGMVHLAPLVTCRSPPRFPKVQIPEKPVLQIASAITIEINRAFVILREIASGKDLKQFLSVIAGLWVLSILGKRYNFLTLVYIVVVLLFTLPVFYEKYDDQVDAFAEKAMIEIKKQYAVFDAKVLSKVPKGQMKDKKT